MHGPGQNSLSDEFNVNETGSTRYPSQITMSFKHCKRFLRNQRKIQGPCCSPLSYNNWKQLGSLVCHAMFHPCQKSLARTRTLQEHAVEGAEVECFWRLRSDPLCGMKVGLRC